MRRAPACVSGDVRSIDDVEAGHGASGENRSHHLVVERRQVVQARPPSPREIRLGPVSVTTIVYAETDVREEY